VIHDTFTLISLALTPLTIAACFAVVLIWRSAAYKAYKKKIKVDIDWFILGVVVGFLGSAFDNLYWGIAWTADYLRIDSKDELFKAGVYSNTFFRQLCTALAATCHIKAALELTPGFVRGLLMLSGAAGLAYCLALLLIRFNTG